MVSPKRLTGFTIVELLIVITVIGILVAIVVVVYNGVTRQANTAGLTLDVQAMDKAQKRYQALNSDALPITYDSSGNPNTTLAFAVNKGNSIIVTVNPDASYCIYGYNPKSSYPTLQTALIRPSGRTTCAPLSGTPPSGVFSTVSIIGQRLEQYKAQYGYYPHLPALTDIGLVIKPNSGNANQQQLYCRNNTNAIYLQIDSDTHIIYVYDTATHSVVEPTDLNKLSLDNTCPEFNIRPSDPGYESTGIKNPDI